MAVTPEERRNLTEKGPGGTRGPSGSSRIRSAAERLARALTGGGIQDLEARGEARGGDEVLPGSHRVLEGSGRGVRHGRRAERNVRREESLRHVGQLEVRALHVVQVLDDLRRDDRVADV